MSLLFHPLEVLNDCSFRDNERLKSVGKNNPTPRQRMAGESAREGTKCPRAHCALGTTLRVVIGHKVPLGHIVPLGYFVPSDNYKSCHRAQCAQYQHVQLIVIIRHNHIMTVLTAERYCSGSGSAPVYTVQCVTAPGCTRRWCENGVSISKCFIGIVSNYHLVFR